jgi:hypothetical protein
VDPPPGGESAVADFGGHADAGAVRQQIESRPISLQPVSQLAPGLCVGNVEPFAMAIDAAGLSGFSERLVSAGLVEVDGDEMPRPWRCYHLSAKSPAQPAGSAGDNRQSGGSVGHWE